MIQISNVRIQNFLSFQREVLVKDICPISVFVGPNNAGKSNFIRSMTFYKALLLDTNEPYSKFSHNDIRNKFHQLSRNETSTISIRYKFEDQNLSRHPLEIDHFISFNGEGTFERERFSLRKNGNEITVIKKEDFKFKELRIELVNEFLFDQKSSFSTTSSELGFNELSIAKYVPFLWTGKADNPGVRIYDEIKKYISNWIFIPADRLIAINRREKDLQERLYRKRKASNELVNDMCKFIGVSDVNFDDTHEKLTSYISEGQSISVELADQGSGLQQVFTMYPQFSEVDSVFFIEEPEVHLHPLLQRKLLEFIIKKSHTNQFFITTQSPIFCRYQKNRIKSYLVKKVSYSTTIKKLGVDEMNEIKSVLGHVNTDLFGYNAVLFVEGDSENKSIPLLANNLKIDIVNDGIRIVDSKGYGNMKQIKNIIDLLVDTKTEVYALSDNHDKDQGELKDIKDHLAKINYVKLEKDFEDSFDKEILIKALQEILHEENHSLDDSDIVTIKQHLASEGSRPFKVLNREYQRKIMTTDKLSKVRLGEKIAKLLTKSGYLEKSEPEKLIRRIHDNVIQQLNLE